MGAPQASRLHHLVAATWRAGWFSADERRGARVQRNLQRSVPCPAPPIATALFAAYGSGYVIAVYIAICAVISIIATLMMSDHTNRDISEENA
jgi:hypothetical protein